jgi:hypothetical protein
MNARRQKIFVDESRHALIRPHLGIQPSTASSHRSGAEIEENRFVLLLRLFEDGVDVVAEFDRHGTGSCLLMFKLKKLPAARGLLPAYRYLQALRSPAPFSR